MYKSKYFYRRDITDKRSAWISKVESKVGIPYFLFLFGSRFSHRQMVKWAFVGWQQLKNPDF